MANTELFSFKNNRLIISALLAPVVLIPAKSKHPVSKFKPILAVAPIKPTQGREDVYLVCKGTGGGSAVRDDAGDVPRGRETEHVKGINVGEVQNLADVLLRNLIS